MKCQVMQVISTTMVVVVLATGAVGEINLRMPMSDTDYLELSKSHIFEPRIASLHGNIAWSSELKRFECYSIVCVD